jgi:thiol-disulfide isomerase/thioredoxin
MRHRSHAASGTAPALRGGASVWYSLLALSCTLAACDDKGAAAAAPDTTSRVEAVAAKATSADALKDFCDVRAEPGQGKPFHFPAVESGAPSAPAQDSLLWLNLWATWCKPCVEELPRIAQWQKQLVAKGKKLDLRFVSVDEDAQAIGAFRSAHPGMPETLHIADPSQLAPLVAELGLDSGAGLPIHVFVEKGARIRCVRAGAVLDSHYDTIASMLQ